MKSKAVTKISYEPEADVLTWEQTQKPIAYAEEVGNFVVHFGKDKKPVLVEILNASSFLSEAKRAVGKRVPLSSNHKKHLVLH